VVPFPESHWHGAVDDIPPPLQIPKVGFLQQLRAAMRGRNLAYSTEQTYVHWIRAFIRFHRMRHPAEMGSAEVDKYLSRPKPKRRVPQVLTHREALQIISHLNSPFSVMARLMYGAGLRLMETCRLRVKDVATTEIYTHVLNRGGRGVVSPIDD